MATEAEIIASNILASAIEYKRLYDTTKKNEYKVKEQRLRQIAENIKLIVAPGSTSSVSSFNGRTGAVTLTSADVTGALGYTPLATVPTLAQVTTAGNTTTNAITVGSFNLGSSVGISTLSAFGLNYFIATALTAGQGISASFSPSGTPTSYAYNFQFSKSSTANNNSLLFIGGGASAGPAANKHLITTSTDGTATAQPLAFAVATGNWASATALMTLTPTQNVLIGTTTDAGYKLDVNGTARVNNHFYLTNSSFTGTMSIRLTANNQLNFGNSAIGDWLQAGPSNRVFIFQELNSTSRGNYLGNGVGTTAVVISTLPAQSSGTNALTGLQLSYNINHTGTYSGIARGIYYNPTLTSLTGTTHRSIETVTGDVILGSTSGNLAVGTTTTLAKVTVAGSITAASALAQGVFFNNTLVAAANNDVLVGLDINPTFTNGAFTGVTNTALRVTGNVSISGVLIMSSAGDIVAKVIKSINASNTYINLNGTTDLQFNVHSSATNGFRYSVTGGNEIMRLFASGNLVLQNGGTFTDAGYKLDVVGADSRFNGVRVGRGASGINGNTVVGDGALNANTTGFSVTAIGYQALQTSTSGYQNTALGFQTLKNLTTASDCVAIGALAATNTIDASANTAIGSQSLFTNTYGQSNTAIGFRALYSNNTSNANVAIGREALYSNTAANNTAVGSQSLYSNVSGISLTAVGYQALNLNTGSYNTAVGEQALQNNTTGGFNAAFGTWALKANTTASYNSAFGQASLYVNTTGVNNSAYGNGSLFSNTTGGNNTSIGRASMFSNISGGSNVAVGVNSLYNSTASNNTAVGYQAGYAGVANTTGSNNIFIGYQATGVSATESNRTWIGNSSTTSTWLAGNVLIGTTTDAGYKLDVNGTFRTTSTITATLANVTTTNVVYYNTTTGLFTYGAAPGGGGGGTVTSVGLSSATSGVTIGATPVTTSGTITIAIATASGSQNGLLSSTDWTTFNNKQNALTLTTTGSSGAATLIGGVLNIPNYGSALTGYVPYTGATTDVNLGTHQLLAARGTFSNNGSTNTLTVDHTSGSGYGIIVTKGGANEALYVNKTSGSGNAMTVVGGRTSLVDLALSSVSNAAGDFLTLSGGVVHRRTAAQVLSDISVPTPTLAQVTTAGNTTTNAITVGGLTVDTNTLVVDATNNRVGMGTATPTDKLHIIDSNNANIFGRITATGTNASAAWVAQNDQVDNVVYRVFGSGVSGSQMGISLVRSASLLANLGGSGKFLVGTFSSTDFVLGTGNTERARFVDSTGNFLIGTTTDNGNKLQVNGTIDGQAFAVNGVTGWTGMIMIPFNPPGMQNIDVQGGIIMNVF